MKDFRLVAAAALLSLMTTLAVAAGGTTIHQRGRAFSATEVDVAQSQSVIFTNDDLFVHQIYVSDPGFKFESDEQQPGTTVQVPFTKAGTFNVMCRIHPKMRLTVNVR